MKKKISGQEHDVQVLWAITASPIISFKAEQCVVATKTARGAQW